MFYYIYIFTASPLCRASPNGAGSEGSEVEEGDSWVHGDVPGSVGLKSRPAQTSITFRNGNVCVRACGAWMSACGCGSKGSQVERHGCASFFVFHFFNLMQDELMALLWA
jgi:hypothetical protein